MSLEHDLRRALSRKDPSPQFADRVIAKLGRKPAGGASGTPGRSAPSGLQRSASGRTKWFTALAAAATIVLAVVGLQRHASQTRAAEAERINQAERINNDVRLALYMASAVLNKAQQRVTDLRDAQ